MNPEPAQFLPAVVGHERARRFLRGVLQSGRVPPGLLLHGPGGCGKHTMAREWLRVLLCESEVTTACGTCESCRLHDGSGHPDVEVVELEEGRSRISIERIRSLREWFSLAPFRSERRCALIDDADRMSGEAQNSLLKLLEEPPGKGLLLLVTANPGALFETVLSRLQAVYVGPLSDSEINEVFSRQDADLPGGLQQTIPVAGGSVAKALELANEEGGTEILEAAKGFFDWRRGTFTFSDELFRGRKKSASETRSFVMGVLEASLVIATRHLREMRGGEPVPVSIEVDELRHVSPDFLGEVMELILETSRRIQGNVNPRLAMESLRIRVLRLLAVLRTA